MGPEDALNNGYQIAMQKVAENFAMEDQIVENIARNNPPIQNGDVPLLMRTSLGSIVEPPVNEQHEREKLELKIDIFTLGVHHEQNQVHDQLNDHDKDIIDDHIRGMKWDS